MRPPSRLPCCRGCGSANVTWRGAKPGYVTPRPFDFYTCSDCQLMFVDPFVGYDVYSDAYYRGEGVDPYVDYAAEYADYRRTDRLLELRDIARVATRYAATRLPPGDVSWLEFGCGAGALLKYLRDLGGLTDAAQRWPLRLTGHDIGPYADRLKRVDGFRILDFAELQAETDGTYDIISMIEVIEHIVDPFPVVALAARLLKPGGLLLLTTGNLHSPIARRQGIHYRYCFPEIHVSLFNPPCLTTVYRRYGLEPYFVRYEGVVGFRVVKSVPRSWMKPLARSLLQLPGVIRLVDYLYGVSAMPCAIKTTAACR